MDLQKVEISGNAAEIRSALAERGIFDFSDYRRASQQTRYAMLAVASVASAGMSDWAVIGWNGAGCAAENRAYWDDYVAAGRESARGSLFVPTLPSIPACEAAIAIGAHAESGYYRTAPDTGEIADIIEDMMQSSPWIAGVIVVESHVDGAAAIAVPRGKKLSRGFSSLKEVH